MTKPNISSMSSNGEFEFIDVVQFIRANLYQILVCVIIGLALAFGYATLAPKQYESRASILGARIPEISPITNMISLRPLESTQNFLAFLKTPTAYSEEALSACGIEGGVSSIDRAFSDGWLNISIAKFNDELIEVRTRRSTPALATGCTSAIFDLAVEHQRKEAEPWHQYTTQKMEQAKTELSRDQDLLNRTKMDEFSSVTYLATRDNVVKLRNSIDIYQSLVQSASSNQTNLIAPIFTLDRHVAPNKTLSLIAGALGGLLFGVMLAIVRRACRK